MFKNDILFWNVDTQVDFMNPDGKLYVPGAEKIQRNLQEITTFAQKNNIQVVNTADYHFPNSNELSDTPDFIDTFPPHCMADTEGAEYIEETKPVGMVSEIHWNKTISECELLYAIERRNIIIRKDAFDVFKGNPYTETIVKQIAPKTIFVYGVTTNVCVDRAVVGLAERGYRVIVIADSIKELPNIPLPFPAWDELGVQQIKLAELDSYTDLISK
jgi:nicotinamidase/pyrazinamidase